MPRGRLNHVLSKLFGGIFDSAATHKKLVGIIALLLTIASAAGLVYIRFDNNVELMLPANDEICKSMRFLRESDISDKVIISFQLKSSQFTTIDLIAAVDTFCASLNTPLVTDVVTGIAEYNIMGDMLDFLKYVPQLTNQQALNKIDRQISPQGVKTALFNNYRSLLGPAGSFMSEFISSDPLGINYKYLHSLEKLTNSFGYKINIKNGHFISSDGTHAMVILKTPVVLTDGFGSKKLINYIKTRLDDLPDYVTADIIAGHMHTISNETVIKKMDHACLLWTRGGEAEKAIGAVLKKYQLKIVESPFRPTAENMAKSFFKTLKNPLMTAGNILRSVIVYETPTSFAKY